MKLKNIRSLFALAAGLTSLVGAFAQSPEADRHGRAEFYLLGQYWTTDDVTVPNVTLPPFPIPGLPPATADMNFKMEGTFMYGLGFAYNFTDKVDTRLEFAFGRPNYELKWNNLTAHGESFVSTGKWNFDYNLLKRPLTPFVGAGIGYFYIDTGIPSGPPEYWIWWDYWWGPVVTVDQPTYSNWYFTYNAVAGLRWDINDYSVVRLSVTANWLDMGGHIGTQQTIETTLGYSWKW